MALALEPHAEQNFASTDKGGHVEFEHFFSLASSAFRFLLPPPLPLASVDEDDDDEDEDDDDDDDDDDDV
jgi:hypothetical protein